MTLRLDAELADQLEAVADVEGVSMAAVVRDALAEAIERRRADPEFRQRLADTVARNQRLLDLLAGEER